MTQSSKDAGQQLPIRKEKKKKKFFRFSVWYNHVHKFCESVLWWKNNLFSDPLTLFSTKALFKALRKAARLPSPGAAQLEMRANRKKGPSGFHGGTARSWHQL